MPKEYPPAWKVLTNVSTDDLEDTLNRAAYEGYRVHKLEKSDSLVFAVWEIILFNPAFITNSQEYPQASKKALGAGMGRW
jgi:hypothetical protein